MVEGHGKWWTADAALKARRWALILLGVISIIFLAVAGRVTAQRLIADFCLSAVEPQPLAGAMRVTADEPLYRDYRHGAAIPLTYGALTYCVPGWTGRGVGLSAPLSLLRLGRVQAALGALATFAFLYGLARQRGAGRRWAWAAFLPLIWFPYLFEWAGKFTPDFPALALSLAGWFILGRPASRLDRRTVLRAAPALIFWLIGFHYKPNILVGPIGFAAEWLWPDRPQTTKDHGEEGAALPWRRRLGWVAAVGAAYAIAALGSCALLEHATGGLWSLNALKAMSVCEASGRYIWSVFNMPVSYGLAVLILMLLGGLFLGGRRPLTAAWLGLLVVESLFMSKQGSNINYLAGTIALWGLLMACALGQERRSGLVALWALGLTAALIPTLYRAPRLTWEVRPPAAIEVKNVAAAVTQKPAGRVLCLDPFFGLTHGLPIPYADGYHAELLATHGLTDFTPWEAALRQRRYTLVVWNRYQLNNLAHQGHAFIPTGLNHALREAYQPVAAGDWLVIWRPKP